MKPNKSIWMKYFMKKQCLEGEESRGMQGRHKRRGERKTLLEQLTAENKQWLAIRQLAVCEPVCEYADVCVCTHWSWESVASWRWYSRPQSLSVSERPPLELLYLRDEERAEGQVRDGGERWRGESVQVSLNTANRGLKATHPPAAILDITAATTTAQQ